MIIQRKRLADALHCDPDCLIPYGTIWFDGWVYAVGHMVNEGQTTRYMVSIGQKPQQDTVIYPKERTS